MLDLAIRRHIVEQKLKMKHSSKPSLIRVSNLQPSAYRTATLERGCEETEKIRAPCRVHCKDRNGYMIVKPSTQSMSLAQSQFVTMPLQQQVGVDGSRTNYDGLSGDLYGAFTARDIETTWPGCAVAAELQHLCVTENRAEPALAQLYERRRRNIPRPSRQNDDLRDPALVCTDGGDRKWIPPRGPLQSEIFFDDCKMSGNVIGSAGLQMSLTPRTSARIVSSGRTNPPPQ